MTSTVAINVPAPWRRWLVLLLFGLVLAACSAGNLLSDSTTTAPGPKGKTPPPVVLKQLVGIPPDKAQEFKDALALAAGQHDIGVVEGEFQSGTYSLGGRFRGEVQAGATQVVYSFELRDNAGVLVATLKGTVTADAAVPGDPGSAITEIVLQNIAGQVSRQLTDKFQQLGFAVRLGAMIAPPSTYFVMAKNGAQFDVDLETLNGPSALEPATVAPADGEQAVAEAAPEPMVPPPPEPGAAQPDRVAINVVAVVGVQGSPGSGNAELTEAMRRTLKAAGWPVVNAPRTDALIVRGKVVLSKPKGTSQTVAVRWVVETPQGKSLGDVKEPYSVQTGSLDQGWGEYWTVDAVAAAGGIFDIIKKYR